MYAAYIVLKCFQHFCATGCITSLTEDNLLTREGFVVHCKHWIMKRHTVCQNKKCREWRLKMWIATVVFAKAFDTTRHSALWNALGRFEVEAPYISILKRSYEDQQATVSADKESDMFKIQRVRKQRNPRVLFCSARCFRLAWKMT